MACGPDFGIDDVPLNPGDHVCGLFFGWLDRDKLMVPFFPRRAPRRRALRDRHRPHRSHADPPPTRPRPRHRPMGRIRTAAAVDLERTTRTGLAGSRPRRDVGDLAAGRGRRRGSRPGSRFLRIGGEVSWWTPVAPPAELARYEAELNRHISQDMAVLCLYDLSRFSPEAVHQCGDDPPRRGRWQSGRQQPVVPGARRGSTQSTMTTASRTRPTPQDISDLVNSGR